MSQTPPARVVKYHSFIPESLAKPRAGATQLAFVCSCQHAEILVGHDGPLLKERLEEVRQRHRGHDFREATPEIVAPCW